MAAGESFLAEIREQPAALERLLAGEEAFADAARRIAERAPAVVRLVGHGSSDNTASYGVYAFGLLPGWTALRDSMSLTVYYNADVDFSSSVVLAPSQSGRTPDVVRYVELARERGALTVALTNDLASPLAQAAELALPLSAGEERAVAATKTYVNSIAALLLLAAGVAGRGQELVEGLHRTAELLSDSFEATRRAVAATVTPFAFVGRMYVIGRGIEFATAREIALKLKETCRVAAEPMTATDFAHGPMAVLDPLFPVWAIASRDASLPAVVSAARRARERGATLIASGTAALELEGAAFLLPVPEAPHPLLAPLLSILPGQLFASALAAAKGLDPDSPDGLTKVTLAL